MADGPAKDAVNDWQTVPASDWQDVNAASGEKSEAPPSGMAALKENASKLMAPSPDNESGFERFAHGFERAGANVIAHPLDTAVGLLSGAASPYSAAAAAPGQMAAQYATSPHPFIDMAADQVGTGAMLGPLTEIGGKAMAKVPQTAAAVREAAMGDPNAAALRGLQVGPKSPQTLRTLKSVEGARPYLGGAKNLKDLQGRIQPAQDEIFSEYNKAVQGIDDRPVKGPDGMTTVRELENERLQLSALNRGLKNNSPEALQLAQQKGMTAAQLLAKEKAVQMALDPELSSVGIDPMATRKAFAQVSQIGSRMSGKSTLIEKPEPSGFGKIANISIKQPLQAPGQIFSGVRDLVAGRPLFEAKPTDLGIREGFRMGGEKPNLGKFQMPKVKGLLQAPMEDLPLHDPFEEPQQPGAFPAQMSNSRVSGQMTTPEGNPNYGYSDETPELPPTKGLNQQGVLRRRKP